MFKLQNRLGEYSASVFGKNVYLKTRDKNILKIEFYERGIFKWKQQIRVESEYHSAGVWEGTENCFFGYNKAIEVRNKQNGTVVKIFKVDGILNFNGQYFISSKKTDRKSRNISLFKIKDVIESINVLKNVGKAKYFNLGDKLFSASNFSIECCSDVKWQQSYQSLSGHENAFLHSRILHHSGKLFFVIDGNENKGLYVLDVDTGELIKKFLKIAGEIYLDGDYIFASAYDNVLCRINTHTLELEQWDCDDLVKSNGFNSLRDHRMCALNNIFYFTQSLGGKNAKLGVLDWGKKELVYQHDFEKGSGAIGSIQATPDRIFVHTQDNTLHIFEKEEEK